MDSIETQEERIRKLVSILSHDLRSPLAYIQTTVELLLVENANLTADDQRSLLQGISNQTQHMLALLNNLLDYTVLESGKLALQKEPVVLPILLETVVREKERLAARKGTRIELQVKAGPTVMADPMRLTQIIENMLSNAIKFSPPGSRIRVGAEPETTVWRVWVQDQGPGIMEKDRDTLFQPFAHSSARPTGGEKSTGLGLAIVRWLVEAHGGQVGVESLPGEGATFWITLKLE